MAVILLDEIVGVRKKLEDVANVFLVRLQMLAHRLSRIQDSHTVLLQTEIDLRGMPLQ
jgi:hypothetical protein